MRKTDEIAKKYAWIDELDESKETKAELWERVRQLEKDASTMNRNSTTAGFTQSKAILPKVKVDSSNQTTTTLSERIADEAKLCEGCNGTDCQKKSKRYWYPILSKEEGVEVRRYCQCKVGKQRELQSKIRSSRIPSRYLGKTLEDYQVDKLNRVAVEFAKVALKSNVGAYFYGEAGTGKTFLASLIAQDFLREGKSVVFVKVPNLLSDIQATFNGKGKELDLLDELRAANLVVLDDFGMEKSTQWAGSTLCKILDMRYDNPDALTIITSNLSLEELAAHLNNANDGKNLNGSRIADRCREICKPILLKGTTRRK